MDIILVRHGESHGNVKKIFAGPEIGLTERGIGQAQASRELLSSYDFEKVYTSPYKRAIETMDHLGLKGQVEEDIREIDFGILENKTYNSLSKDFPEEASLWAKDPIYHRVKGGESVLDAYKRVTGFLDRLISQGENSLLICHDGTIKIALSYVFDQPEYFFRFKLDNLSFSRITIEDNYKFITGLNQTIKRRD